jgi:hypothetical protein
MKKVLLKDLVIPTGTVFNTAPSKTERDPDYFVEAIIGLTKNTFGTVTYEIEEDNEELKQWFADLKGK